MTSLPPQTSISTKIWLSFDWKQAELFAGALFSRCEGLKQALLSADFHRTVASWAFGVPPEVISKEQREIAKMASYAWIYSAGDINATTANVLAKAPHLKRPDVEDFLRKYMAAFPEFFQWIDQALYDWYDNGGMVHYLWGAPKRILPPDYLKRDIEGLRRSRQGRVAINTFGQNSVGLLLKACIDQIARDDFLQNRVTQLIPMFDALYLCIPTHDAAEALSRLHRLASPVLRLNDFEIQFSPDWKGSVHSWGELRDLPTELLPAKIEDPWVVAWEAPKPSLQADLAAPVPQSADVNPFLPSGGLM